MDMLLHKAATRGYFDHGWLRTHHTFSFADYYDPARLNFGALRVLNDDTVVPGAGFGMHPHREMEVVSIPLSGRLEHKDSLGHADVIRAGEIQAMSAGTGIYHSEYNPSRSAPVEFLQIWIFPNRRGVKPRYENAVISDLARPGELSEIVSPYPGNGRGLWIYQDAWLSLGDLRQNTRVEYVLYSAGSYGVYVFVVEGNVEIAGTILGRRDGLGVTRMSDFSLRALSDTRVLLIEVPPVG